LRLQRPVTGDEVGVWTIDYLTGRELAGDDVDELALRANAFEEHDRLQFEEDDRGDGWSTPIGIEVATQSRANERSSLASRWR